MFRSLVLVAVAAALGSSLTRAAAADPFGDLGSQRWYVSGIVGGSFMTLTSGGENTAASAANAGAATGGAFTGGGALGLAIPSGGGQWRAELEGRQRARLAGQTNFVGDPFLYDVQAADGWSVTANLWRDIPITDRTGFYACGGIGGGGYRLTVDDQIYAQGYNRTGGFAWQAGGGLVWSPSDRLDIDLGYRFFAVDTGSTPLVNQLSGGSAGIYTSSLSASEVLLTFRIYEPLAVLRGRR
ncbi:MAG: outer membrane protein [Planctomycetia bacterium]